MKKSIQTTVEGHRQWYSWMEMEEWCQDIVHHMYVMFYYNRIGEVTADDSKMSYFRDTVILCELLARICFMKVPLTVVQALTAVAGVIRR